MNRLVLWLVQKRKKTVPITELKNKVPVPLSQLLQVTLRTVIFSGLIVEPALRVRCAGDEFAL